MFVHTLTVRFRDLDALNHVNNAVYLTYLEEARLAFSAEMGVDWSRFQEHGFVIARCEIDYRHPAVLGDVLRIELTVGEIGRSAFEFRYRVVRASDDRLIAEARTVQVCFDFLHNRPARVPEAWRIALARHQCHDSQPSPCLAGA
ncbi:MAG: thioesterase family protein [Anaerolineae bacterium]|nr:acyl-CoA thioesterase [Thermoflexales bacterium]MDW8406971.1 thioesterase family protein [Anaerolineae bacterium]